MGLFIAGLAWFAAFALFVLCLAVKPGGTGLNGGGKKARATWWNR